MGAGGEGAMVERGCFPSTAISLPPVLKCNRAVEAESNRKGAKVEIIWWLIVQSQSDQQNYIKSIVGLPKIFLGMVELPNKNVISG